MFEEIRFKTFLLITLGLCVQSPLFGQFDDLKKKELLDAANRLVVERDSVQLLILEARASIALLTEQKEVQSGEIELLRTDIADRDSSIDELEKEIESKTAEIEALEKNVASLNNDFAELNRQLNVQEVLWNDKLDSLKAANGGENPADSLFQVINKLEGELKSARDRVQSSALVAPWNSSATFLNRVYSALEELNNQSLELQLAGVYTLGSAVRVKEDDNYYDKDKYEPRLGRYYTAERLACYTCYGGTFPVRSREDFIANGGISKKYGCEGSSNLTPLVPEVIFEFTKGKLLTIKSQGSSVEKDWMLVGPEYGQVDGERGIYWGIIDENDERYNLILREFNNEIILAIPHELALLMEIVSDESVLSDDKDFGKFHYSYSKAGRTADSYFDSMYEVLNYWREEYAPVSYQRTDPFVEWYAPEFGASQSHWIHPSIYLFRLVER